MKITNKYGLPDPIVRATSSAYRPKEGRLSVTDLSKPARIVALERKHWDELEEDASDRIWMLLGSCVHAILSGYEMPSSLTEEKLTCEMQGYTIAGVSDLLTDLGDDTYKVSDYKVTSAYSVADGNKKEYEEQVNFYAHLYRLHGFKVIEAELVYLLRDWSRTKVDYKTGGSGYPKKNILSLPVTLYDPDVVEELMQQRVKERIAAIEEETLPYCSDYDRWAKKAKFAVAKNPTKKAIKLCNTEQEAQKYINLKKWPRGVPKIFFRPGKNIRCQYYCSVSGFCHQYQKLKTIQPRLVE